MGKYIRLVAVGAFAALLAVIATLPGMILHPARASASISSSSPEWQAGTANILNYYPSDAGWDQMWLSYSHSKTDADFAAINSLGANTVRLIIQPSAFGWPVVNPAAAANLEDAIDTAAAHNLYVQLTLFDLWGLYTSVQNSQTWLASLLGPYADDHRIGLVELQNEIDPANASAMSWARSMLAYLPQVLPGVQRTLSVRGMGNDSNVKALLNGIDPDLLDVVDLHLYGSIDQNSQILTTAKAMAGSRRVIVGEAGLATDVTPSANSDYAQASYYSNLQNLVRSFGIKAFAPWTLNDFTAEGLRPGMPTTQAYFGLRRTDGTWKPAANVVQTMFAASGQLTSSSALADMSNVAAYDGTFDKESATPSSTGVLGYWAVANRQYAAQSGVNQTAGHNGGAAAYLTNTSGPSSSVPSVFQQLPIGSADSVALAAYGRVLEGTGSTRVAIAWFSGSTFLSQTESAPLFNTTSVWQQIDLTVDAPSGATSFQVHLKSQSNTGTAYFSDVSLTYGPTSPVVAAPPAYDGTFDKESATATAQGVLGYWAVANGQYASQEGINPTAGRDGGPAAYLTNTSGPSSSIPAIFQQLPVGTAASVRLAGFARLAGGTGSTRVAIAWFTGSTFLSQTESAPLFTTTSVWQALSVSAAAPSGATSFQVSLKSQTNTGTAYFDDMTISYGTSATSFAGIVAAPPAYDGTFDKESATATAQGVLGYWAVANGQYASQEGINPTAGRDGGPAAYLTNTSGPSSSIPAIFQQLPVGTAASVRLAGFARLAGGTGSTRVAIAWFTGSTFLSQTESAPLFTTTSVWQALSVSAAAPSGATSFQVSLKSQTNTGTAYFDDMTISYGTSATSFAGIVAAPPAYDGTFDKESATATAQGVLGYWAVANGQYASQEGINPTAGRDGGPAAYLTNTSGPSSSIPAIFQQLPVGTATSISLTAYGRLTSATGGTRASIAWFSGSTFLSQTETPSLTTGSSAWQPINLTVTPPSGATSFQVHLKSENNAGTAYFDDVTVSFGGVVTAPVVAAPVYDGTFDEESATPTSLGVLGYWSVASRQYVGQAGVDPTAGRSGGPAGYLSRTTGTSSAVPALFQQLPLAGSRTVSMSAFARIVSGTGSTRASIAWFSGGTFLGQSETPMLSNTATGWQPINVTATAPTGATSFQVHLKSQNNSGTAYFDDVALTWS